MIHAEKIAQKLQSIASLISVVVLLLKLQSSIFQFCDAMFAGRWDIPILWIKSPSKGRSVAHSNCVHVTVHDV